MGLNTLTGGAFQDETGSPLANGSLVFELSHDEQETTTSPHGQVVAGLRKTVNLDNNGNVVSGSTMWANDVMNPANSFYIVTAFDNAGRPAWKYPQYITVPSSPNPFDLGTVVPTNPPGNGAGGSGAPVGSLLLQTNEVNNGSQSLLDLHAGTNVTLTDNGSGRVTVAATGGAAFQTNGTPLTSATTVNFQSGTGITVSNPSAGNVLITNTGTAFSTAGQGFFWGPGLLGPMFGTGNTTISFGSNTVFVYAFILQSSFTIRNCSYIWTNTIGSTGLSFGIYSYAGNLLLDAGSFNVSTGNNVVTTKTFSGVVFAPGIYYFAQACDNTGLSAPNMTLNADISGAVMANLGNAISKNLATAANPKTSGISGALPSTLGSLTAVSDVSTVSIAIPLWSV